MTRKFSIKPRRAAPLVAYGAAVLGVAVATLVRLHLDAKFENHEISFGFYFLAVSVAAWLGGIGPALFASLLGCLVTSLRHEPIGSVGLSDVEHYVGMVIFLLESLAIGALSELSLRSIARAQAAEAMKDDFIAMVAHELRSPISVIHYANQLNRLSAGAAGSDDERSKIIDRQVEQLTFLVDDLLDVSRITRGKIHLHIETLDAADLVMKALEKARPLIDSRAHSLHVHMPPEPLTLNGDRRRLEQVLINLLTNAAKYTPENGEIIVSAFQQGEYVAFSVRDNGVGIPSTMLHRIFDLFTQIDEASESSQAGLGLGLSIVRGIVELHGGLISVESEGPDRGSEFTVRLPAHASSASCEAFILQADGPSVPV